MGFLEKEKNWKTDLASALTTVDPGLASQFESFVEFNDDSPEMPGGDPAPVEEDPDPADDDTTDEVEVEVEVPGEETGIDEDPAEDDDPEEVVETAADEEFVDPDDAPIESIGDLAEAWDVPESDLLDHLKVPGIQGDNVSLKSVMDYYYDAPKMAERFHREVESTRDELRKTADKHVTELTAATSRLMSKIEGQEPPPGGWDRLRQADPGEYLRLTEIQAAEREDARMAMSALEEADRLRTDENDKIHKRYVDDQSDKLYRLRPDWKDPKSGRAAFDDIDHFLKQNGFNETQIKSLEDANSIVAVWKAAQYDKAEGRKPEIRKRLRKLPTKQPRVTARVDSTPQIAANKQRQAISDKFRKTGRIEDSLDLFKEHL